VITEVVYIRKKQQVDRLLRTATGAPTREISRREGKSRQGKAP
jgi:hypothetical protein